MPENPIVCDTTVLLYPSRIGLLDLLPTLFASIYVPEQVMLELDMGRLFRQDTVNPRNLPWAKPVSVPQAMIGDLPANRLGTGERAVIAYANVHHGMIAGLDDRQARQLAESLGLEIVGTLGILLRAKQADLIPAVRPSLDAAIDQGFRVTSDLYQDVLRLAKEA